MKRLILILFAVLALNWLLAEDEISSSLPQSLSPRQEQLQSLQKKAEDGLRNADLYYNIGVLHYQLGSPGQAQLWFLRALRLNSAHRLARENVAFIQSLHPTEHMAPPPAFVMQIMFNIYAFFSLNRLAVLVLVLGLLCALSLHWLLHYPPQRERAFPLLVLLIVGALFLASLFTLLYKSYRFRHDTRAVVMQEGAPVHASRRDGKALYYLPEGYVVNIVEQGADRMAVVLPDGSRGWMAASQLERVAQQ